MFGFFKSYRRQKLLATPLPDEWQEIIKRNVAVHALLSPTEQQRLWEAVRIIDAERSIVGLQGFEITDEIAVTIAAQAALLILGEDGYYFDRVGTIYVQPGFHRTRTVHDLGGALLVREGVPVQGQAWDRGVIRLAWDSVVHGGRDPTDGENVVLHEFAHHLDALDDDIDGVPPLPRQYDSRRWQQVFDAELAQLRDDLAAHRPVFLHAEAAENRAELFAYSTECFFEQPHDLAEFHPELFECLLAFYKTDPRAWFKQEGETEGGRDGGT
jgi:Mlc titration factor MtfA (ptsG expression regulator)